MYRSCLLTAADPISVLNGARLVPRGRLDGQVSLDIGAPRWIGTGSGAGDGGDPGREPQRLLEVLGGERVESAAEDPELGEVMQQACVEGIPGADGVHQCRRRDGDVIWSPQRGEGTGGAQGPKVRVDGDRHPVAGAAEQVLDDGAGGLQGERQGAGVHRHGGTGWWVGSIDDRGDGIVGPPPISGLFRVELVAGGSVGVQPGNGKGGGVVDDNRRRQVDAGGFEFGAAEGAEREQAVPFGGSALLSHRSELPDPRVRRGYDGTSASRAAVVQKFDEQAAQLSVAAFTEAVGQLLLDTVDGGDAGGNARLPPLGQDDQLGPPVCRVRAANDIVELLELVNQFTHRLRRHLRPLGQLGQPRTFGGDLRKDSGVGGPLGKAGAHHAIDDPKSQQAVGAAEQGNGVDGLRGLCHIVQDSLNIRDT